MAVQEGDIVKRGDLLFTDKKCEGVRYTSPAGGRVSAINRGAKRAFQSVVVEVEGDEAASFDQYSAEAARELSAEAIKNQLIQSGQWTALRARPFGRVADPATSPAGLFITAIDTQPHAPDPQQVIAREAEAFELGQTLLANLAECPVYLCAAPGADMPQAAHERISRHDFSGPHPAGLAGTHVHFLMGASARADRLDHWLSGRDRGGATVFGWRAYVDVSLLLAGPSVSRPRWC
jgi:Na+-transporting NADH:ubiquinone oxidoreductase subunit A